MTWPRDVDRGFGRASGRARCHQSVGNVAPRRSRLQHRTRLGEQQSPSTRACGTAIEYEAPVAESCASSYPCTWDEKGTGPMDFSQRFIRWGKGRAAAARRSCGLGVEKHMTVVSHFLSILDITLTLHLKSPLRSDPLLIPLLDWCNGLYRFVLSTPWLSVLRSE